MDSITKNFKYIGFSKVGNVGAFFTSMAFAATALSLFHTSDVSLDTQVFENSYAYDLVTKEFLFKMCSF